MTVDGPSDSKRLHFTLTADQAVAVIELVNALEETAGLSPQTVLAITANDLDAQMSQQQGAWEVCKACEGTGWIEDSP